MRAMVNMRLSFLVHHTLQSRCLRGLPGAGGPTASKPRQSGGPRGAGDELPAVAHAATSRTLASFEARGLLTDNGRGHIWATMDDVWLWMPTSTRPCARSCVECSSRVSISSRVSTCASISSDTCTANVDGTCCFSDLARAHATGAAHEPRSRCFLPITITIFELADGETAVEVTEPFAPVISDTAWRHESPALAQVADCECAQVARALDGSASIARCRAQNETTNLSILQLSHSALCILMF